MKIFSLCLSLLIVHFATADLMAGCEGEYKPKKRHFESRSTPTSASMTSRVSVAKPRLNTSFSASRHQQLLREIDTREKRLRGESISSSGKTSLQAQFRALRTRLTSAEKLGRIPGNDRACQDIYLSVQTELLKLDRIEQTYLAQAQAGSKKATA